MAALNRSDKALFSVRLAYLNGEWGAPEAIRVSVLDRGFLFGDGVYEVIPIYDGRPFRLQAHLARLERSLASVRIEQPHTLAQWVSLLEELVERSGAQDPAVYLQVTRGVAMRGHPFPPGITPTVLAMGLGRQKPIPADGIRAIVRQDNRWGRCDIKAITLLANILLRQEAIDQGAEETILCRDGLLAEAAASNVFIVHEGRILTPPEGPSLLSGITRGLVLELAQGAGLACAEQPVSEDMLREADEVWLTASTLEIAPVIAIDGIPVGNGRPGSLWRKLDALYREYRHAECGVG